MDRARIEDLWSRFLSGETLTPEEEGEVADALDADPRLRADLTLDLKLDRSLVGLGRAAQNGEAFLDSFSYRLRAERDGTRFIATMKQKMRRTRRPPTRRWEVSSFSGARVGVAAALLLTFIALLLTATSTRGPGRKTDSSASSQGRPLVRPELPEPSPVVPESRPPAPPSRPPEKAPSPLPAPSPVALPLPGTKETTPAPPPVVVDAPERSVRPDPGNATVGTPARSLPVAGSVTRVSGDAVVVSAEGRTPVKAGQKLYAGQSLESVGPKSGLQFQFADGTRVDLGADTLLSDVSETDAAKSRGKRIVLARGVLNADVAKQPAEQPLIVATPQGEARVVGTVFRLSVEPGVSGAMRLDVKEGKVRLTRSSDQKSIDVPAGCYAATGAGGDLDLNSEHKLTVSFQDGVSPTPRYAGTSDTILLEAAKLVDKNMGAINVLWVDGDTTVGDDRYTLLRWDVTTLPARCLVLSASIDVTVTNDSRGSSFELYEVKRDWVEKEATWKSFASKSAWQTPGAQGAQDRGSAVLGVMAPAKAGAYTVRLSPEGLAALQSWVDQPASNHGFVVANPDNTDAIGFHSREASLPANRPRLNVTILPRAK